MCGPGAPSELLYKAQIVRLWGIEGFGGENPHVWAVFSLRTSVLGADCAFVVDGGSGGKENRKFVEWFNVQVCAPSTLWTASLIRVCRAHP
jgi:hypothetical protein